MNQVLEMTKQRGRIYELLSYGFLNTPSEEFIQLLNNGKDYFDILLEEHQSSLEKFSKENLDLYTQEYYDRFFVPTSKAYVPPYESAIRNRRKEGNKVKYGKLDSHETFHVKACYKMVDFNPEKLKAFHLLRDISFPDHIAFELAFLTQLVVFQITMLEKGEYSKAEEWRKLQKQFAIQHILPWIGDYAKLAKEKKEGLYSYLASVATVWIQKDLECLDEVLREERGDHIGR